ncbi:hypothetical protein LOD99_7677 [Oopsacas minuta]|uniref:Formimidoyltransferase-cyclodeaminase n=1 Tax=Oopsacas minuta TaxID=111878 RepID=A0AAV7JNS3_9METZ|nr:hypothetical protein LOD99_7677 [Oopsacas minuta]
MISRIFQSRSAGIFIYSILHSPTYKRMIHSKIIECVPNFSEGRDTAVIEEISKSIQAILGCTLLHVDAGVDTNRTVYTFVGSPDSVIEAALAASKVARTRIDMKKHSGEHPRLGALDVCPFIPVKNVSMEECVNYSKTFGSRLSAELNIPIYLYEQSQQLEYRRQLADIRKGEYEGLADKLIKPEWKPDYGSTIFVPEWGATVCGARKYLIAYNVNLLGTKEQAHRIALNIRETGRGPNERGLFDKVRAIGWWLEDRNIAQISINLGDWEVTNFHTVFEECKKQARALKLTVMGSELIGLVPLNALLQAAEFYIQQDDLFIMDEGQKVQLVADRVGLNSLSMFDPSKRIIEYMLTQPPTPLLSMSVREFIQSVGGRTPLPGGGCVAALTSSLGAALGFMYCQLSYGQRKYSDIDHIMRANLPVLNKAHQQLMLLVQEDSNAYESILEASRMKKGTPDENDKRNEAIQLATKRAINSPLQVIKIASSCWESLIQVAEVGNANALSDLQVGAKSLEIGIWGACRNVEANLPDLEDKQMCKEVEQLSARLYTEAQTAFDKIQQIIAGRLQAK